MTKAVFKEQICFENRFLFCKIKVTVLTVTALGNSESES